MAIQVNILDNGQGIEYILMGIVKGQEIIEMHEKVNSPDILSMLKYKIIDKSMVKENYISAEEVKIIADLDKKIAQNYPNIITAIVVPNDLIGSSTYLWEAIIDKDIMKAESFFSREEADKWINEMLNKT